MNPNERQLLQETHELAQENNKILKGIRRSNRWASFFRTLYWVLVIGISVGAFYYVQPYVDNLLKAYQIIQTELGSVKTLTNKIPTSLK